MSLLSWLERRLGWLAIPNISLYLAIVQGIAFLVMLARPELIRALEVNPVLVVNGEWWRLLMFLFIPPTDSIIWIFFELYLFFIMGTALEMTWGTFRYNIYLLISWTTTIALGFLPLALGLPSAPVTNGYFLTSVFLAFAFLYPNFVVRIWFLFPVQVKWLALLTWIFYAYRFFDGDSMDRVAIAAAILNFLIFFSADLVHMILNRGKRAKRQFVRMQSAPDPDSAFHRCEVCGRTDKTNPELEFRYCPLCGGKGYCMDHIATHQHVR